jgi:hypothetical protein
MWTNDPPPGQEPAGDAYVTSYVTKTRETSPDKPVPPAEGPDRQLNIGDD